MGRSLEFQYCRSTFKVRKALILCEKVWDLDRCKCSGEYDLGCLTISHVTKKFDLVA